MLQNNLFTGDPLLNFAEVHPSFTLAYSFAKMTDSPFSKFIQGSCIIDGLPVADSANNELLSKAALEGDPLACLKMSEFFSTSTDKLGFKANKEKSWVYLTMAAFYSFMSPFGLEMEIRPIFTKFIEKMGDDPKKLTKTLELIKHTEEPVAQKYKELVYELLPLFFDDSITVEDSLVKFNAALDSFTHIIDYNFVGLYMMNVYSGEYEKDAPLYEQKIIAEYFSKKIPELSNFI
jgi:hypothetical protein